MAIDDISVLVDFSTVKKEDSSPVDDVITSTESPPLPLTLKQSPDELATTYFFSQFTDRNGHWNFLRANFASLPRDRVLSLAIRACGMAALDNVQPVTKGREYARALYTDAITQLNAALRDPVKCKTDESLMAVAMLGYYEVCRWTMT